MRKAYIGGAVAVAAIGVGAIVFTPAQDEKTYQELQLEKAAAVPAMTLDDLDNRSNEFWSLMYEGEPTLDQARDYITPSMTTALVEESRQFTWEDAARVIKQEHMFIPIADLSESTRTEIEEVSATEINVTVENVYLLSFNASYVPDRVTCTSYETWINDTTAWKLDSVDNSMCDYKVGLAKTQLRDKAA